MLSGVLVAYTITKRLMRKQKINVLREYIARYIRIVPNIIVIMLTTSYILPLLAEKTAHHAYAVNKPSELCKSHGWRNIFMIQNWFKFEEMCNLHTHHIGTDFELFIISPFLLMLLWKSQKKGIFLISSLAIISTIMRFYVTFNRNLTYFVPFSVDLSTLIDTANYLYIIPTHRFTVYGIGLLLGFALRTCDSVKLKNHHIFIGNAVSAFAAICIINTATKMTGLEVEYNKFHHAFFAAFAPILACIPVSWMIFSAQNGYKSKSYEH